MADVTSLSRTRLMSGYQSAKSQLARIRDAAEEGARRLTIAGAAAGGAYGTGYLHGWATRTGKDITIGDGQVAYTLPIGAVATLAGAFAPKMLGETLANVTFGAGIGMLSAELAFMGQTKGATIPVGG